MAGGAPTSSQATAATGGNGYGSALYSLFVLFFMWGFITCMNDILIPALKEVFELNYFEAFLVQFAFFGAYFVGSLIYFIISFTSGDPINRIGYKNGIIAGLLISATACALFYPAAEFQVYGFFLGALFLLGIGFTLLQIAANPYVAILGPEDTASSRLNLAQAFNSFGTTIAPLIGGFLVFQYFASEGQLTADSVKIPYLSFAAMFLLVAAFIRMVHLPRLTTEEMEHKAGALQFPQLRLGMLAIFFYVGGEVAIGSILINYLGVEKIAGLPKEEADVFLAFYWGGAMIGRFLGAISLSKMPSQMRKLGLMLITALAVFGVIYGAAYVKSDGHLALSTVAPFLLVIALNLGAFMLGKSLPARTLAVFAVVNILLLLTTIVTEGQLAFWSVIGIGLFNSIMWSNIFTLAIAKLGKYTSQGSSLLVMAILGGALIPPLQGAIADAFGTEAHPDAGLQISFLLPIVCYAYLFFYGVRGYRPLTND